MKRSLILALALVPGLVQPAGAQGYLLRLDSRAQSVAYRGVRLDSIPATSVVTAPDGRLETPDGHAVSCNPGAIVCEFYRPGDKHRGGPLVLSGDLSMWGFGVTGLSLHANGRLGLDIGTANAWPGTEPALQLLEGYLDYSRDWFTGRLGRQVVRGRLGYSGFDGAFAGASDLSTGLSGEAYIGYGLARAVALPVTAPALSPLDDFQPHDHHQVAGANGGWRFGRGDLRVEYQREVDRDTRNFVSERVALSAGFRPAVGWSLTGGADYDIARGFWGTADARLAYGRRHWGGSAGIRRYRPYFDLWTIWGAFSPVPYTATNGSLWIEPISGLELHAGGERYWYADPEADPPLQDVEKDGWRWSAGAGVAFAEVWTASADYQRERGPGAASNGVTLALNWQPSSRLGLSAHGGRQVRPLEFRYNQSELTWFGLQADVRPTERLRFNASVTRYAEDRNRPDASAFDWDQFRLVASMSVLLGSSADRPILPPPVRRPGER